jgi:hypothetical protein
MASYLVDWGQDRSVSGTQNGQSEKRPAHTERRRWKRVPCDFDVLLTSNGRRNQVGALDISTGGIRLCAGLNLSRGARAYLSFILPAGAGATEVNVIGSVVRAGCCGNDSEYTALAYEVMLPGAKEALEDFVAGGS